MNYFAFFVLLFSTLTACNSHPGTKAPDPWKNMDSRDYEVSGFRDIRLKGAFRVILQQSGEPGLSIKAATDDFDHLDVNASNETLHIEIKDKHFTLNQIVLYIQFEELEKMYIEGGVKLETKGYIELSDFYIHVEGGAKIDMEVKADHFQLVAEGGVFFNLKGVGKKLNARTAGASYINAKDLKCEEVEIRIEGLGASFVHATHLLTAHIDGLGRVNYKGDPEVHKSIGGLGFVAKK